MDSEASKQQTAGIFDRAAATYNSVGPCFFDYFAAQLVEAAQLVPGAHILDVATGSGAVLRAAANVVGSEGHATGVDLSSGMIARTAQVTNMLKNVSVQMMDAEALTFPDSCFDVVLCGFAVFFFPDYQRALSEMRRVLKPDGVLALSTWGTSDERYRWSSDVLAAHAPPSAPTQPRQTRVAGGPAWDKPEGLVETLSAAGFSPVRVSEVSYETFYRDEQEWLEVQWSHGARAWLEPLPPERYDAVVRDFFAHLRLLRTSKGIPQRQTALIAVANKI